MTNIGLMTSFLGIKIKQNENDIFICQRNYANEILKKFHIEECKEVNHTNEPKRDVKQRRQY